MTQKTNKYDDFYRLGYDFDDQENTVVVVNRYLSLIRNYQSNVVFDDYLEIGCGSGIHLNVWVGIIENCHGLDISQSAVNLAKKRLIKESRTTKLYLANILSHTDLVMLHDRVGYIVSHRHFPNLFDHYELNLLFFNLKKIVKSGGLYIFDYVEYFIGVEDKIRHFSDDQIDVRQHKTDTIEMEVTYSLSKENTFSENYYLLSKEKLTLLLERLDLQVLSIEPWNLSQKTDSINDLRSIWIVQF